MSDSLPPMTDEQITQIGRALADLDIVENGFVGTKGRYGWSAPGFPKSVNMLADVRLLLAEVQRARSECAAKVEARVEPPELAAIRERVATDFVTNPDTVSGPLSKELMQARIDRRALLHAFDVELDEYAADAPRMPLPAAQEAQERPETREGDTGTGTGVQGPHGRPEAADEALKAVHYREAAQSLRNYAHRGLHPERFRAFRDAADLLDSTARDLTDEEAGR